MRMRVVGRRLAAQLHPANVFHRLEPKQENIGQSDPRLIGRLEEPARQAIRLFRTSGARLCCCLAFLGEIMFLYESARESLLRNCVHWNG